jgi:hypothetical protein
MQTYGSIIIHVSLVDEPIESTDTGVLVGLSGALRSRLEDPTMALTLGAR